MPDPIEVGLAEFAPDLPALATGSSVVSNVIPRTPTSYGPFSSLAVYSSALNKRCQGAYAVNDSSGNVNAFAGTATDLNRLVAGAPTWTNVSSVIGSYNTPADFFWRFAFMNAQVIATNGVDKIQSFNIDSATIFGTLSTAAPTAKDVAVVKNFLIAGNTNDAVFGLRPQRVWWSALNDPTNWPTLGTAAAAQVQSDANDIFGDGGSVQRVIGNLGTADGAVFMEHAVWRIVYAGPPAVFDFFPAEGVQGTPSPGSVIQRGALVYYLGEDGFYVFDGTTSTPIGANKVDKYFFTNVDQGNLHRIVAAIDPINKLVIWGVPFSGNVGGSPNVLLMYQWQLNKWSITNPGDINCEYLFRAQSFGYTLDGLDTTGFNIDTLPFSLDSRIWTGGNPVLAAFDLNHKLNFFTGATLAAKVDTSEANIQNGRRSRIINTRPLIDGTSVTPSILVKTRDLLTNSQTSSSAVAINSLGYCPQNTTGRYVAGEITTQAGDTWTQMYGMEVTAIPQGQR